MITLVTFTPSKWMGIRTTTAVLDQLNDLSFDVGDQIKIRCQVAYVT